MNYLGQLLRNVFLKFCEYVRNVISLERYCVCNVQKSNLLFRLRRQNSWIRTTAGAKFKRVDSFQSQINE